MLSRYHLVLSLFLCASAQSALADALYFSIPEGDVASLKSRLAAAQSQTAHITLLKVGGDYHFSTSDELPEVRTNVQILADQRPARFIGIDGGPDELIRVSENGVLNLGNIEFRGFDVGTSDSSSSENAALLSNRGTLNLVQLQFLDNLTQVSCNSGACTPYGTLVSNAATGNLRASQVSIVNSGAVAADGFESSGSGAVMRNAGTARITNIQLYLSGQVFEPAFLNTGEMWLRHVSFMSDVPRDRFAGEFVVSPGRLQVSNSIFAGFAHAWCDTVISAGFNLVDNPRCVISSREDIVGQSAGLRWAPIEAYWRFGATQLLTHALTPIAASPAVDSANENWCTPTSLEDYNFSSDAERSRDGDGDGITRCDRGAVEIRKNVLQASGINGLYFNPQKDGHYVYVTDTDFNTFVMWTTFDARGKQAWIFGVAEKAVAGRSLIADAFINRNGRMRLNGQFDPATSEPWGRLEVDLTDCDHGTFVFTSDLPGFSSGEFEIQRLAHIKRLGCQDYPAPAFAPSGVVNVPDGDVEAFIQALEDAATRPAREPTEIIINGKYVLQPGQVFPAIQSDVTVRGGAQAAVLSAHEDWNDSLFVVESNAALRLVNLETANIEINGALIRNEGLLELERVQFSHIQSSFFCFHFGCSGGGNLIINYESGTLRINRVSIVESGTDATLNLHHGSILRNEGQAQITNLQLFLTRPSYGNPFLNYGTLRLENASMFALSWNDDRTLFSDSVGQTEIGNSIVSGFDADWCGDVESLGHNLVDNPDCTFNSDGDIVGQPADMLFVPVEADWNPGGREVLRHALVPLAESRAIDSGGPYACSSGGLVSQLRNPDDGDGDGISACDRGAVERIPSTVDKGGINGLYFNPDADGHYVYIAETTHNTVVMWTTFDSRGKQAWIFGIGDEVTLSGGLVGFLLPTDAYINLNGKVRLDGTLKPAESLPWGTITVRMTSCNQGRLIYESNRPGFGSGQFEFERLAFINQVGCVEGR